MVRSLNVPVLLAINFLIPMDEFFRCNATSILVFVVFQSGFHANGIFFPTRL